jgi:hypothetical protein
VSLAMDIAGVVTGGDRVEPVGADEPGFEPVFFQVLGAHPAHRQVQGAVSDPGGLGVGGLDPCVYAQLRHRGAADGQVCGQPVDVPEPDRFGARHQGSAALQVIGPFQQHAGMREQGRASRGEGHRAAVAVEQPHPEVVFERLDLLRQGGPGNQQPLSGPPEVQLLGRSTYYHQAFHDVTTGTNTVAVRAQTITGYQAAPGWDPVTGWGSPNAQVLVPLLARYASP